MIETSLNSRIDRCGVRIVLLIVLDLSFKGSLRNGHRCDLRHERAGRDIGLNIVLRVAGSKN